MFVAPLLTALLQSAGAPAADTIRNLPPASLRGYISSSDYPAEAFAKGEQGSVEFRVLVGIDGAVKSCTVVKSSGSSALDARTCAIMQDRLRFLPGRDEDGQPVEDYYSSAVSWRIN